MAGKPSASPPEALGNDLSGALQALRLAVSDLPDVIETTSYGTPALKVGKKLLARVKDADTIVLMCPLDEKEMLLEAAPDIYFETDHYKGWPAILVRVHVIAPDELRHRLERTFVAQAPKALLKAWQASRSAP
ncbi:MmcQ/YjbR family DNA-binding protein [Mesorhizobium waimense]|uniref:MmcQ/YjbR family DNA-binding protein n=1 Tax=Mesorhizobium waimense TaxID=1300307 RepID=A0A3A5L319_9HYPH|nr:MmcQ/YjbR family DNA-binding protein [Mesorhizobium waimense]RJT40308.1 MmcQ/YjbR family DNA-binding protein [Mesorhizobium waimense]